MARTRFRLLSGLLAASAVLFSPSRCAAQAAKSAPVPAPPVVSVDQPDAQRTREELSRLLERYPPSLRSVLALDPSLVSNQAYLAPYPALAAFLNAHPEIARNPSFYIGRGGAPIFPREQESPVLEIWRDVFQALAVFAGFGMAIGLLVWLIRTFIDFRRWNRLAKVQTDVHTKLLDRFTSNEDLMAYIHSPAGSKFLESAPIKLDAGPRSVGAPLGRILWSVQGGLVLTAGGIGFLFISGRVPAEAAQSLNALGVLGIALGIGFVASAIVSFAISYRLGLIELSHPAPRTESPGA